MLRTVVRVIFAMYNYDLSCFLINSSRWLPGFPSLLRSRPQSLLEMTRNCSASVSFSLGSGILSPCRGRGSAHEADLCRLNGSQLQPPKLHGAGERKLPKGGDEKWIR